MLNLFILQNIIHDKNFAKSYINLIQPAYFIDDDKFQSEPHSAVFDIIKGHYETYGDVPTMATINDAVLERFPTPEADTVELLSELAEPFQVEAQAYTDAKAKEFIETNAMLSSFMSAAERLADWKGDRAQLAALLDSLHASTKITVLRDRGLGNDDHEEYARFITNMNKNRVPFRDANLNRALNDGFAGGTVNVFCAGSNVGKTAVMVSQMADNLRDGRTVFYGCCEEDRAVIRSKLLSNLSGVPIHYLDAMPEAERIAVSKKAFGKVPGRFVIQTFSNGSSMRNVEAFIDSLNIDFDIFYLDYVNLFSPNKPGKNDNLYMNMQHVTSEMKALAAKYERPIVTATQTNRAGLSAKDPGQADVSQSVRVFELASFFAFILEGDYERSHGRLLLKFAKTRGYTHGIRAIHVFFDKPTGRLTYCPDQAEVDHTYHGVEEGQTREVPDDDYKGFSFTDDEDDNLVMTGDEVAETVHDEAEKIEQPFEELAGKKPENINIVKVDNEYFGDAEIDLDAILKDI